MKLRTFVISLAALCTAVACEDAKYSVIQNRVYIEEATGKDQQVASLTIEKDYDLNITVRLARAADHDVTVKLAVDESLVDNYNKANNTDYMVLPEEYYEFEPETVIHAGHITSDPVVVKIKLFNSGGSPYAFPIRIESAEGATVTQNTSRMLYRLAAPHIQSVPTFTSSRSLVGSKTFSDEFTSPRWTVEFWVKVSDFSNPSGGQGGTFDGCSLASFGSWFMRYWNAGAIKPGLPCLQWQAANGTGYFDSSQFWLAQTWYHIAYVADGSTVQMYVDGEPDFNLATTVPQTFNKMSIGSEGTYTWGNVSVSMAQIRIWTKDLTQSQIKDAMTRDVAVNTDGLFRYWKCNDASGNTLKEYVAGDDFVCNNGTVSWTSGLNFGHLKD